MSSAADRTAWTRRLEAIAIPDSRLARMLGQPLKNARIALMRRTGSEARVAAPTFWGDTFHGVLPEAVSALVWRFAMYEKATSLFLLRYLQPGATFVDIGAHFGYFSLLASRLVGSDGRVVAIEAMPTTFGYLDANLRANDVANVTAVNLAAAAEPMQLTFRDFGVVNSSLNSSGAARGVLAGREAAAVEVAVEARRGDDILRDAGVTRADIIKIDAESSEEQVLAGLDATLAATPRPMVLIELGGGDAAEDVRSRAIVDEMARRGFGAFVFAGGVLRPIVLGARFPYANIVFADEAALSPVDRGPALSLSEGHAFA